MAPDQNIALLFATITALNLGLVFVLRYIAVRVGLLDYPGGRKTHSSPTPLIGGITIYFVLLAALFITNDLSSNFAVILCWASLIFSIGFLDDLNHVPWPVRLSVQVVAAFGVIISTNIEVTYLGHYPLFGPIQLGLFSAAFTVLAVVALTNAYNLIDGINGLCGSLL